jgi:hypothetical protein
MVPGGFDVTIDAVGFRHTNKSWKHKLERALLTEVAEVLDEAIRCTKKGGVVSIVGDYVSVANRFPIGAAMEKHLTLRGGKVHPQKYWKDVFPILRDDENFDKFFTHNMNLSEASKAYKKFDRKEDGIIKVFLIVDNKEFVDGRMVDENVEIASSSTFTTVVAGKDQVEIMETGMMAIMSTSTSIGSEKLGGKDLTTGRDVNDKDKGSEKVIDITAGGAPVDATTVRNAASGTKASREKKDKSSEVHGTVG